MDRERLEASLEGINHLLSHLHGEVTDLEESYSQVLLVLRKLEGACEIDDLTKLMRRKSFFHKWNALLNECEKINEACGVMMIDIDHFKKVNDEHGHPVGDEVIKGVAQLLKQFESNNCVVGRYGGEEFVIATKGTDSELHGTAELIRRMTEKLDLPVKCTVSIGIATADDSSYDPNDLLKAADDALYAAKAGGRNQVKTKYPKI